jgi:phosphohistidine phosphatase
MREGERFIVLLRHGIAEDRDGSKPDEDRELTDQGHRRMKEIAPGLAELFPKAEVIVSSPLIRARQTAEWIGGAYDLGFETSDALSPGSDAKEFRELLGSMKSCRAIFVGHEPTLSAFMLALTGMKGSIELKKGGCYGIRIGADGAARLEWMLPPRAMRP